jgi:hypothetical protein
VAAFLVDVDIAHIAVEPAPSGLEHRDAILGRMAAGRRRVAKEKGESGRGLDRRLAIMGRYPRIEVGVLVGANGGSDRLVDPVDGGVGQDVVDGEA